MEGIQKVKMSSHTILTMGANANQRTMGILYGDKIAKTIKNKKEYFPGDELHPASSYNILDQLPFMKYIKRRCDLTLFEGEMLEALYQYRDTSNRIAILCSASPDTPCEGFKKAPYNQEGRICSVSALYAIMSDVRLESFYLWNREHRDDGNYPPHAIWLPNVPFYPEGTDKDFDCNIISISPPLSSEDPNVLENLKRHLRMIFAVARDNRVDTLILSPYGLEPPSCWSPDVIVDVLMQEPPKYEKFLKDLVFVVPKHEKAGYSKFVAKFRSYGFNI